ncbi:MurT ligase domain-containing protein [Bacillus sp. FDAARGOS_235]|uniref:MurT ligase domain-containing protein n=1 Tax=Bacillus sp. FDAARGOS_235 TaxID=1839798 RepID=UPI00119D7A3F|nr:MurT ligase domain-containing protein [Bacillus sp. FDAARGOS_235]
MLFYIGLLVGKLAGYGSKKLGFNGSNIPGKILNYLYKNALQKLATQVETVVLITGTNGKTTTCNLVSSIFKSNNSEYISNIEGSNLLEGITSAFIKKSNIRGKIQGVKVAVLEVDELTMTEVLKQIQPQLIVVTNIFRDQLDRYGEINTLISKLQIAIHSSEAYLLLNGDDPYSRHFTKQKKKTMYFGLKKNVGNFHKSHIRDAVYCFCGRLLKYTYTHYGHLGKYYCSCSISSPALDVEVTSIQLQNNLTITIQNQTYTSNLKGEYNAYNMLTAIKTGEFLGFSYEQIHKGLREYHSSNGRMQQFLIAKNIYHLNLAKNPQGMNCTIDYCRQNKNITQYVFILNDLIADGKDISWIWDVDYEILANSNVNHIICAGTRAYDLAVRLKYAGISVNRIKVIPNISAAIQNSIVAGYETSVISNYTGLNTARQFLSTEGTLSPS